MRPSLWIVGIGAAALGAALGACGGDGEPPGPSCADPARGPAIGRFVDVTRRSGVDFLYSAPGFQGGGLAVVDLDGDDLPEIVAGRRVGGLALFSNRGALRFDEVEAAAAGLDGEARVSAIGAGDLDNDGDRDLVIAGGGVTRVMAGRGDGTFAEAARLDGAGTTEHVLLADLDGDGLVDLHLGNYDLRTGAASKNRLYMNRSGPLALKLEEAGVPGAGLTWTATAFDHDDDGDLDLHVANDTLLADFGVPGPPRSAPWPVDLFLRNDGPGPDGAPRFTDIAEALGLARPRSSMGGLLADFDEDGRLDLYVTDFGANKLFVRDPAGGGYVDRAAELGVAATARRNAGCGDGPPSSEGCLVLSWSAALSDFDLDGRDELLVVNGETSPGDAPPVVLLARGEGLPYHELAPEMPCMDARGLVVTDLDADGDQDVVIAQKEGPLLVYENRGEPAPGTWLRVLLRGRTSNREGVGAKVTARLGDGRVVTRVVGHGGVIHSASPPEAFFGLGALGVESLEVRWPSGRRTEVARPAPGATIVVDEGP